ncbi:MAG: GNAT family N-acetyltransferase [Spirochaetales bacterium]|nr:GNAT family N-acetyltransferase [Spirochaetales bacterium]
MEFAIEPVESDEHWDQFVEASPQGSLFSLSFYLKSSLCEYLRFWVLAGSDCRGAFSIVLDGTGGCCLDDMVIYNGPIFASERANQKANGVISERFRIQECIIAFLTEKFSSVAMALAPQLVDVRPYLWYNYGSSDARRRFSVSVRYTSYLDISDLHPDVDFEKSPVALRMDGKRRQSLRRARQNNTIVEVAAEVPPFLNLYRSVFLRQGVTVTGKKMEQVNSITRQLLESNKGRLYCIRDESGFRAAALFGWDAKRAYYLFGALESDRSDDYSGTAVLWHAFRDLAKNSISEVDLEGVNSPARGWFKLSFGGNLLPYYEVSMGGSS